MAARTAKTKVDDGYLTATSQEALTEDDLIKLSVFMTAGAREAMSQAIESTGDSATDTINRALHVYAALVTVPEGTTISFDRASDGPRPDEGTLPRVRRVTVIQ